MKDKLTTCRDLYLHIRTTVIRGSISTYLNKLTTCGDELGSVGIMTADDDMVSLALLGLPKR